jgi:hypothetical protein
LNPEILGQTLYIGRVLVPRWTNRECYAKANIALPGYNPMLESQFVKFDGMILFKLCAIVLRLKLN